MSDSLSTARGAKGLIAASIEPVRGGGVKH